MKSGMTLRAAFVLFAVIVGGAANAADLIQVTINNDDLEDVFVSVYDLNTQNTLPVLVGERINFHGSKQISVTADGNGRGHITWAAKRASGNPGCGSGESKDLNNGDAVSVVAKDECTAALTKKALGNKPTK
jgi:hypothetical protein